VGEVRYLDLLIGIILGVAGMWLYHRTFVLDCRVNALGAPSISRTEAQGEEGDVEEDEVMGKIGFRSK